VFRTQSGYVKEDAALMERQAERALNGRARLMRTTLLMAVLIALAVPAGAQHKAWPTEPSTVQSGAAASADGKPPRLDPLSGPQAKLKPKEAFGVRHGKSWADNPDFPARGADGGIVFLFGATLPVVVCAPLYVCDLSLEVGEVVNDINIGDGVRWQITPATQGSGAPPPSPM
jgi:hypothetical protein